MNLENYQKLSAQFANLSKEELIERLTRLERAVNYGYQSDHNEEHRNIIHELEVHQVELEMQNRELRDSQIALEKATERFALLYEYAPVGYCTTDLRGTIRQINNTAKNLFGQHGTKMLGTRLQRFIDFEPGFDLCSFLQDCHEGLAQQAIEGRCVTSTFDIKSIQIISIKKPFYPDGERQLLLAFIDKTSERIKHQSEMFLFHASEVLAHSVGAGDTTEQAVQMAQSMSGSVVVLDTWREGEHEQRHVGDGRVGKSSSKISRVVQVLENASRADIQEYTKRCRTMQQIGLIKKLDLHKIFSKPELLRILHDDGLDEIVVAPLYAHGHLIGVMSFLRGNSAPRRNLEGDENLIRYARLAGTYLDNAYLLSMAEKSAASRKQLLAVVSHDLRSPLCAIRMRSERLLNGRRASKESYTVEAAHHIIKYAERMDHLVGDLLDVSIVESGALSMKSTKCSVADFVAELLDIWQLTVDSANVRLAGHTPTELWVRADRERLFQATGNIIGNAIKFTPRGGSVTVTVSQKDSFAHFTITDTGIGIAQDRIPFMFNKFWQATDGDKKGFGLGLAIAKGIIESAGGRIWVESEPGLGTNVHFLMPLWRDDPATTIAHKPSVLVVEDDIETATMVKEILEDAGNRVDVVHDGSQALKFLVENAAPKLILLDLHMPTMDGWQFLQTRRSSIDLSALRVIVYSGEPDVAERAASLGAEYLPKDCPVQHLLEMVG